MHLLVEEGNVRRPPPRHVLRDPTPVPQTLRQRRRVVPPLPPLALLLLRHPPRVVPPEARAGQSLPVEEVLDPGDLLRGGEVVGEGRGGREADGGVVGGFARGGVLHQAAEGAGAGQVVLEEARVVGPLVVHVEDIAGRAEGAERHHLRLAEPHGFLVGTVLEGHLGRKSKQIGYLDLA